MTATETPAQQVAATEQAIEQAESNAETAETAEERAAWRQEIRELRSELRELREELRQSRQSPEPEAEIEQMATQEEPPALSVAQAGSSSPATSPATEGDGPAKPAKKGRKRRLRLFVNL